jgi:type I restriction-modification system DNA methylase subunit
MNYSAINIQGNIISSEVLEKIRTEDIRFQQAKDFNLSPGSSLRDEISLSWSLALSHWKAFSQKRESLASTDTGTSETRQYWMKPLMNILGYDLATANAEIINGKSYAISHRAVNMDHFPVHLVGINLSLDKRAESGGPRLSPHALAQEYLNHQEHLYALVSNGMFLRLVRDATKLSRLSYLEFNLQQMMEEGLYAEFALLYRLLHASRMPATKDAGPESKLEYYHQEALASGSRIRERLSLAVETSIKELANGFLHHTANDSLREAIAGNQLNAADYYLYNLRTIYRLLFLMVIEERNLIFPENRGEDLQRSRTIYYSYYSLQRLCRLVEKMVYVDPRKTDLWQSLVTTFALFEHGRYAAQLGISPLGSGLFAPDALGIVGRQMLDNETLLKVLRHLVIFENENGQRVRVNYADLDVEEFGSVYEGLLEYEAQIQDPIGHPVFLFKAGKERSKSGSHYTPEELVKPLIQHSLDYLIQDKLKEKDPEAALLSLKVCDVACGSGHILLSAARRIGFEVAKLRSREDQPAPTVMRQAVRDVIKHCIYGVDKNPLAIELCKVAMWLEAHNPGEPLHFLDHHIKCGDAIVGLAHKEELEKGIADEAFVALTEDEKQKNYANKDKKWNVKYVTVASAFAEKNKNERKQKEQAAFDFDATAKAEVDAVIEQFNLFKNLPERTPEEVAHKVKQYKKYEQDYHRIRMQQLADAQVAQFFIPKTAEYKSYLLTDAEYRSQLRQVNKHIGVLQNNKLAFAEPIAKEKRFFHWFLEFPEVFQEGGFDCILGNPPFLGDKKLKNAFGERFLEYFKFYYTPAGVSDLIVYFLRRIYQAIKKDSFLAIISTNTISQGDAKDGGLDVVVSGGGEINFCINSIKWPGKAEVVVSLLSIYKGKYTRTKYVGLKPVISISTLLREGNANENAFALFCNQNKSFIGNYVLGLGFVLEEIEALSLIDVNENNKNCVFPYLNGDDLNSSPIQKANRWVINFNDLQEDIAKTRFPECFQIITERVKPERLTKADKSSRDKWWLHARNRPNLYNAISDLKKIIVTAQVSKTVAFSFVDVGQVYDSKLIVFPLDKYFQLGILQSNLHYNWAWKYCTTMKNDLSYTPEKIFETFPFPQNLPTQIKQQLGTIGEAYHEHRRKLMLSIQLGLTKTYNAFHSKEIHLGISTNALQALDKKAIEKQYCKEVGNLWNHLQKTPGTCSIEDAIAGIVKLRGLHVQMDIAVLDAYGWSDMNHNHYSPIKNARSESSTKLHDFYEVDYLPENDCVRYTIHPDARKEVLKRLLELNHKVHDEEVKAGLWDKKKGGKGKVYNINEDDEINNIAAEPTEGLWGQA